jgi:hypothetical protein
MRIQAPLKRIHVSSMDFDRWYNKFNNRNEGREVAMRRHNRIISLHRDRYARALYRSALYSPMRGNQ